MAPTESEILSQYLLTQADLPTIISLEDFTSLFPRSHQNSPQIRSLYRDLQAQRNTIVKTVEESIQKEVIRGREERRVVMKKRREAEAEEIDDETEVERALWGSLPNEHKHSLNTIIPELESAAQDMGAEIAQLEAEEAHLLLSVKQSVGGLSDLRYGRFSNSQLPEEIIQGLKIVEETCQKRA